MTLRTVAGARVRAPLTELENDVMQAVWDAAPCSVEAVHQVVSRNHDVKETTVRTLLRRLEQKGYLRHEAKGRAYVYYATEPSRSLAARAVRQIIDRLCRGSIEELVSGMVDAKVLSQGELKQLAKLVRADSEAEPDGASARRMRRERDADREDGWQDPDCLQSLVPRASTVALTDGITLPPTQPPAQGPPRFRAMGRWHLCCGPRPNRGADVQRPLGQTSSCM